MRNVRPNAIPETEADEQKEDHVDGHCRLFPTVMKAIGIAWAHFPRFTPIEHGIE
jgi:hypothetical protein